MVRENVPSASVAVAAKANGAQTHLARRVDRRDHSA
jgi:hypothetical protein